jgi:hypothetical protein
MISPTTLAEISTRFSGVISPVALTREETVRISAARTSTSSPLGPASRKLAQTTRAMAMTTSAIVRGFFMLSRSLGIRAGPRASSLLQLKRPTKPALAAR